MKYRECPPRGGIAGISPDKYIQIVGTIPNDILAEIPLIPAPQGPHRYESKTSLPAANWGEA